MHIPQFQDSKCRFYFRTISCVGGWNNPVRDFTDRKDLSWNVINCDKYIHTYIFYFILFSCFSFY